MRTYDSLSDFMFDSADFAFSFSSSTNFILISSLLAYMAYSLIAICYLLYKVRHLAATVVLYRRISPAQAIFAPPSNFSYISPPQMPVVPPNPAADVSTADGTLPIWLLTWNVATGTVTLVIAAGILIRLFRYLCSNKGYINTPHPYSPTLDVHETPVTDRSTGAQDSTMLHASARPNALLKTAIAPVWSASHTG